MKIPYNLIAEKIALCGSISAAAQALSKELGCPVHKGSLARAYRERRDLTLRPRRRRNSPLFERLRPEHLSRLFYLATKWAVAKAGDSHSIEAWELADRAKDLLLRLSPPEGLTEEEVFAWALTGLRRYIFLRNCDLRRRPREISESDLNPFQEVEYENAEA